MSIYHQKQILIVEDDRALASSLKGLISQSLSREVLWTDSLDRSFELVDQGSIDVLVVDWILTNKQNTLELIEYVVNNHYQIKILMLTCKNNCCERLEAYKQGVDAYLAKPFESQELLYILQRLLSSYKLAEPKIIETEQISLQPETGLIKIGANVILLRPKEMAILTTLFLNRPNVVSKDRIISQVWSNPDKQPSYNTIEVYLRKLRQLLTPHGIHLGNKRGFGYYFSLTKGIEQ